jgi:uncharacterized protein
LNQVLLKSKARELPVTTKEIIIAADQGYAKVQCALGIMYINGRGVPKDYAEAIKWLRKAAEQGNADALINLGWMYFIVQGVPKDYVEAAKWYRKAAEKGDVYAQNNLGSMYSMGHGVTTDYGLAYMWFNLSAASSNEDLQKIAATAQGELANKMTSEQIAEAEKLAREWKPKTDK